MTIEILTIPCLSDNYAFLIHESETGETALVDVPEAAPILDVLRARGWSLQTVLLTHHHDDHIQGLPGIQTEHSPKVIGAGVDQHRLPPLDLSVADGDVISVCGVDTEVWDVSGHTVGHVAFVMRRVRAAFTADSLMALGCGRVFEGSFDMMWNSLSRFAALPDDTVIYSGHEYTTTNGKFALSIDPDNADLQNRVAEVAAARAEGTPTVPSILGIERATNPFLRASDQKLKKSLEMSESTDAQVFGEIRRRKDNF